MQYANDNKPIRFLSVCSGIEAASVAWEPLGWRAVGFAEIDKAASALLAYRYPDVPNYGDFSKLKATDLPRVDILCGGTPCQAFSVAGARRGLDDDRGNLSLEFVRLAHELATSNGLRNAAWENVPGVLTMADNAFGCFLAGLVGADSPFIPTERRPANGKSSRWWRWAAKEKCHAPKWPSAGMVDGPKGRAAWIIKDAQFFGLAQRRERVLVVADFGNGADPAAVLFERGSVPWNPPARGKTGEGVAPTISARTKGGGGLGTDFDLDGGLIEAYAIQERAVSENIDNGPQGKGYQPDIAYTLEARNKAQSVAWAKDVAGTINSVGGHAVPGNSVQDASAGHLIAYGGNNTSGPIEIAAALNAKSTQRQDFESETFLVGPIAFTAKDYGADAQEDLAPTLRSGGHKDSHANAGVMPAIAFNPRSTDANVYGEQTGALDASYPGVAVTVALRGREGGGTAELGGSDATALRASSGGGDKPHVLTGRIGYSYADAIPVDPTSAVRRLTPRECERLMGFPDDYTRIPVRRYSEPKITRLRPADMWEQIDGEWWLMTADGPRYKQLGNSWAVPKFRWLGERIARLMPPLAQETKKAA